MPDRPNWELYISSVIEGWPNRWLSPWLIRQAAIHQASATLSRGGQCLTRTSSLEISPSSAKGILREKLRRREVVCKLGYNLGPFFVSGRVFGTFLSSNQRKDPTLPTQPNLREVASNFNRRVDDAWSQAGPLPDPWAAGEPHGPGSPLRSRPRRSPRPPITAPPQEEPIEPVGRLFPEDWSNPEIKKVLGSILGDSGPLPDDLLFFLRPDDLGPIIRLGLEGLRPLLEERRRDYPVGLEERYFGGFPSGSSQGV